MRNIVLRNYNFFETLLAYLSISLPFFIGLALFNSIFKDSYSTLEVIRYSSIGIVLIGFGDLIFDNIKIFTEKLKIDEKEIYLKRISYSYKINFKEVAEILIFRDAELLENTWLFVKLKNGNVRPIQLFHWRHNPEEVEKTLTSIANNNGIRLSETQDVQDINLFLQQQSTYSDSFYKRENSQETYKVMAEDKYLAIFCLCFIVVFVNLGVEVFLREGATFLGVAVMLFLLAIVFFLSFSFYSIITSKSLVLTGNTFLVEGESFSWNQVQGLSATYDNENKINKVYVHTDKEKYEIKYRSVGELVEQFTYFSRSFIDLKGKRNTNQHLFLM